MDKHTPGPWTTLPEECEKPYIRVRGTIVGSKYKIANVLAYTHPDVSKLEAQETRANANLIAAAPDLLAALESMVNYGNLGAYERADAMKAALKAIAKAKA